MAAPLASVRSLALALGLLLLPASASAQPERCGEATRAWVERASKESGHTFLLRRCAGQNAWLDLPPDASGSSLTVELSTGEGAAFRRAGSLRFSPLMNGDWRLVPAEQRAAFDALVGWVEKHPEAARLEREDGMPAKAPPAPSKPPGRVPWRIAAALVLAVVGLHRARSVLRCAPRIVAALAALFALSLGLRAALGLWGPFHANGQGPLWIEMAWRGTTLPTYGAGYPELYRGLASLGVMPDTPIFATNTALSSVLPVLLVLLARLLGASWGGAGVVGLALAVDPISIHMAATESYFVPIQALLVVAALAGGTARKALAEGHKVGAITLSLAAGLVVSQLFRVHPLAWPLLSVLPFVFAGVRVQDARPGAVLRGSALVGGLSLLTAALTLGTDAITPILELKHNPSSGASGNLEWLPLLLPTGLLLAMGYRARTPEERRAERLPLGIVIAGHLWASSLLLVLRPIYGQSQVWQRSFDVAYLVLLSATAAALAAPRTRREIALFAAPFLAFFALSLRKGTPTTTEALEYRWLRAELPRLEENAMLIYVGRHQHRVLIAPEYALRGATPAEHRSLSLSPREVERPWFHHHAVPLYYLHGSLCEGVGTQKDCEAIEANLKLSPISSRTFPAVASHNECPYREATATLALSRVTGR